MIDSISKFRARAEENFCSLLPLLSDTLSNKAIQSLSVEMTLREIDNQIEVYEDLLIEADAMIKRQEKKLLEGSQVDSFIRGQISGYGGRMINYRDKIKLLKQLKSEALLKLYVDIK